MVSYILIILKHQNNSQNIIKDQFQRRINSLDSYFKFENQLIHPKLGSSDR